MMAVGTTLLCAACINSPAPAYGPSPIPDAGMDTADAGQADAAVDVVADTENS
jgi:hypothetical protein